MATITEVVRELSSGQVPVICLDTCDFLDVVRGVNNNLHQISSFNRMFLTLNANPGRFRLLITFLTKHEWDQNKVDVERSVASVLSATSKSIRQVAQSRLLVGLPATIDPRLFDSGQVRELVGELVGLAGAVIDLATVLEKDDRCVDLALERVMDRRRPSHKNEIKDSIHWEHTLELSRQLKAAGHTQDRIFVSANKADFWADRDTPAIHPDLVAEANAAGLGFFGRLDQALRSLGI